MIITLIYNNALWIKKSPHKRICRELKGQQEDFYEKAATLFKSTNNQLICKC